MKIPLLVVAGVQVVAVSSGPSAAPAQPVDADLSMSALPGLRTAAETGNLSGPAGFLPVYEGVQSMPLRSALAMQSLLFM